MKPNQIRWTMTALAVAIAALHFIRPTLSLDTTYIVALVLAVLPWLAPIVKSIELPGGFKIEVQDVKEAIEKVIAPQTPLTEITLANERQPVVTPSEPSDSFVTLRQLAATDPNLALVGFRVELERRLASLAQRHGIDTQRKSAGQLLRELRSRDAIPSSVASGLADLLALGNQAAHGADVSPNAARWMLEVGPTVLGTLDQLIKGQE